MVAMQQPSLRLMLAMPNPFLQASAEEGLQDGRISEREVCGLHLEGASETRHAAALLHRSCTLHLNRWHTTSQACGLTRLPRRATFARCAKLTRMFSTKSGRTARGQLHRKRTRHGQVLLEAKIRC